MTSVIQAEKFLAALRATSDEALIAGFHEHRGAYLAYGREKERDVAFFHHIIQADCRLIVLCGERGYRYFSLLDLRACDYFSAAGEIPFPRGEVRGFLDFLLAAKVGSAVEHELDRLLIKIVDEVPTLGEQNLSMSTDDRDFFDSLVKFAEQVRYRSEIFVAGKAIPVSELAGYLRHIYYGDLAEFLHHLACLGLSENAEAEAARGRGELAQALRDSAILLRKAGQALGRAGDLLDQHTNANIRRSRSEHIFDPGQRREAKIAQFVRAYLLTLRMHKEREETGDYELLEGMEYHHELAKDPDFEAMIVGLINGLELFGQDDPEIIEREINQVIGRDIWVFRAGG